MRRINSMWFLSVWMLLFSGSLFAQTISCVEIRGITLDSLTQQAAPFITIIEKGTSNGTTSDLNGYFFLCVNIPSTIQFSGIGYQKKEIVITEEIIKNQPFLSISILSLELNTIITKTMGGCGGRVDGYPTLDLITDLSFEEKKTTGTVVMGCGLTIDQQLEKRDIFYRPNEHQLEFFLTNNR